MKTLITIVQIVILTSLYSCHSKQQNDNNQLAIIDDTIVNHHPDLAVNPATIQIALLLDTSNSMDGLINQVKTQLWNLVNKMTYAKCNETQANLEIALYEYGNSRLSLQDGYLRQVVPFTTDLDLVSSALFALNTNGGDEYCGAVISHATSHLEWRNGSQDIKMMFIAGNESFIQGTTVIESVMQNATEHGITVNTIYCGDTQTGISLRWKDGAVLGSGEFTVINHNQQTHYVTTPYDQEIIKLNQQLNDTYIAYGATGYDKRAMQAQNDVALEEVSPAASVNRSVVKSKSVYNNQDWDLIDAADNQQNIEQLIVDNKSSLDPELRNKSVTQIKQIVEQKKILRTQIQQNIQLINAKREAYLKSNASNTNELENSMIEAVKKQAKLKNYTWTE